MKFSLKIVLSVLVLLALSLSLCGYLMIHRNFSDALDAAVTQNTERHNKDVYFIESEAARSTREQFDQLTGIEKNGDDTTFFSANLERYVSYGIGNAALALAAQAASDSEGFAILVGDAYTLFSSMPDGIGQPTQIAAAGLPHDGYRMTRSGDRTAMLMSTPLIVGMGEVVLVSAFDVSAVYASRDAQLRSLVWFTLITMAVGALLAVFLSQILTRPLKKLETASGSIAGGNYAERTGIETGDEFASLSRSFDSMAEAVERNIRELEQNIRAREDFVSAFTHEIKTPMTSMMGYASLLRTSEQDPETVKESAGYIWRETKRLEALSGKLMLLMGLKERAVEPLPVSVKALFSGLEKTLPAARSGAEVHFSKPGSTRVLCDKVLIDDLLRNLIVNGQRACKKGGTVEISCKEEADTVVFAVSDNGCGIAPEELPHITEPFYMVEKSRSRADSGSGLGLALSAKIAELHGTALRFESAPGVGTCVRFTLPRAKEEPENEE